MGSGFKDWAAGDVLTAADVDGYLMRQTVMTFADASARDTALSGVLDEGMVAYLEDVNALTVYNGSAWVAVIDSDVLTVDTSNNRVGINDSTPSYALDVTGDINASGDLRIGGTQVAAVNTFTPVVKQGTTTFTVTTSEASYYQINKLVYVIVQTTIATGTGQASQAVTIDLPVATTTANGSAVGSVFLFDSSVITPYGGQVVINSSTTAAFAGDWGIPFGNSPAVQYTTNDQIRASFCYEVA